MRALVIALLLINHSSFALGSEWSEIQSQKMENVDRLSKIEQIETLGQIVSIGSNQPLDREAQTVFERSQSLLLSIPGHAEYYGDRLWKSYSSYKTAVIERQDYGPMHSYRSMRPEVMRILENLPSAETVRVLGEMLSEEWSDPTKTKEDNEQFLGSLAMNAKSRLVKLPIVDKPIASGPNSLPAWQQWYGQIKDGKRTFRFEGNPQEYNLQGPAREALTPNTPRATKRPSQTKATTETEDKLQDSRSNAPKIVTIIAAILLGGSYWLYTKKSSSL